MKEQLRSSLESLVYLPGLSGHEEAVCQWIAGELRQSGLSPRTDRLGNLIFTLEGSHEGPSIMVFAHMDQLGFIVRKIRNDGLIRVERLGGVPERALAAQAVTLVTGNGNIQGIIGNKSHHATLPDEKYEVVRVQDILIDTGHGSRAAVEDAGVKIGTPVVYTPRLLDLAGGRVAGTALDDRAGCAVLMEVLKTLQERGNHTTVHGVFSVQEEFNLRGAAVAAQALRPDLAIQIDIMLSTDLPGMEERGDVQLGGGPTVSHYSFHGRGTLNGLIPHPAMVRLLEEAATSEAIPLQRSAHSGLLTDNSYVQVTGNGVAAVDVGIPARYSHSALEVCELQDLESLARLLVKGVELIGPDFEIARSPEGT